MDAQTHRQARAAIPDFDALAERFRAGDLELPHELRSAFFEQLASSAQVARDALASADLARVRFEAHTIKGMGGTVDEPGLSVLGLVLEEAAVAADPGRCAGLLDLIDRCLDRGGPDPPSRAEPPHMARPQ